MNLLNLFEKTGAVFESRSAPLYHSMNYTKTMKVLDMDLMPARWKHAIYNFQTETLLHLDIYFIYVLSYFYEKEATN
jgi:DUF1365 family protein